MAKIIDVTDIELKKRDTLGKLENIAREKLGEGFSLQEVASILFITKVGEGEKMYVDPTLQEVDYPRIRVNDESYEDTAMALARHYENAAIVRKECEEPMVWIVETDYSRHPDYQSLPEQQ